MSSEALGPVHASFGFQNKGFHHHQPESRLLLTSAGATVPLVPIHQELGEVLVASHSARMASVNTASLTPSVLSSVCISTHILKSQDHRHRRHKTQHNPRTTQGPWHVPHLQEWTFQPIRAGASYMCHEAHTLGPTAVAAAQSPDTPDLSPQFWKRHHMGPTDLGKRLPEL